MKRVICNLLGISEKSRVRPETSVRKSGRRLHFQGLEDRQVFSASPLDPLAHTAAPTAQVHNLASQAVQDVSASGTLARKMFANDTEMWLNNWGSFPVPQQNAPYLVRIDSEQIKVFSVATTTGEPIFSVQRGVNGTIPQDHAAGATVVLVGQGPAAGGTQAVYANFGGALWEHLGTDKSTGWFKLTDSGVTSFSASTRAPNTVFVNIGGAAWEHVGTDRNTGWFKIWDTGVNQISAGSQISAGQSIADVSFVVFNGGALYEHIGTDKNLGWFKLRDTGVTQISASQGQADTVFANFSGAVWEHNGRDGNSGWTKVWDAGVTQISASSAQSDTVFVTFSGGALWEHTGLNKSLGWTKVWDAGVTQFSVASSQPDTVFVTISGALWQHTGLDKNTGWSKIWDTAVTQISAAPQDDTVFALINGGLWGHVGKDKNSGWFKLWDSAITDIAAGL
jgi:hypothetical protein